MLPEMRSPARVSKPGRAAEIKAFGKAFDGSDPTQPSSESPAVHYLIRRFRLSATHARVVSELAGIGVAA